MALEVVDNAERERFEMRDGRKVVGWAAYQETAELIVFTHTEVDQEIPADSISFMFLGRILVTYHNESRQDTFGPGGVSPRSMKVYDLNGKVTRVRGGIVNGDLAHQIRDRKVSRIEVELG